MDDLRHGVLVDHVFGGWKSPRNQRSGTLRYQNTTLYNPKIPVCTLRIYQFAGPFRPREPLDHTSEPTLRVGVFHGVGH